MTQRKHRTPEELILETEERLNRLRAREAKNLAKSNPQMVSLFEQLDKENKIIREAKKILGTGPQSAVIRMEKHKVWIDKIQESADEAIHDMQSAEDRKLTIEKQIEIETQNLLNTFKTQTN